MPVGAVRPRPATRWVVDAERRVYPAGVQPTAVHRADCWTVTAGTEVAAEEEARAAMARPGARGCCVCGTDMSLA
ncbi:DUF6233 domain-containing protein [Streptomyces sp. NBC_00873]|uniref:DUF6233 domain-containing protein n=1 Tax=Streptomyces sp. NBC_00873 TaxID=2975852 RepID=UPI0038655072|nr:DUF6233 domain-containing protein [Streptomyces sp. NBC_00873]WTA47015.1 DUF6233 domain-containing protein [Streptomyces sp. NBC_00842]